MLKDFANAAVDARKALELNNAFVKSYFRLASALKGWSYHTYAHSYF
jgi:hypothetical protein